MLVSLVEIEVGWARLQVHEPRDGEPVQPNFQCYLGSLGAVMQTRIGTVECGREGRLPHGATKGGGLRGVRWQLLCSWAMSSWTPCGFKGMV